MRPLSHRRLLRALLCLVLSGCGSRAALSLEPGTTLDRYAKQGWSTESGLPQNSVHAMLQTSDGYLWMATEGGLVRFNGYQFRTFDRDSAQPLAGNDVHCLLEDRSHVLWIGTSSGLTRMQDGVTHTYTMADGLPADAVRSLVQTTDGTLWALTTRGLASAIPGSDDVTKLRFRSYSARDGMLSDQIHDIVKGEGGGLWVATEAGLNHIRDARVERGPEPAVGVSIDALTVGVSGTLFFATPEGVFQLRDNAVTTLAKRDSVPLGGVHELLATPDGVWAAGRSSVILIQPDRIVTFKTGQTLPGEQIQGIFADRNGAVWIGTNNGIARWWKGRMESSLAGTAASVLSLYEDRDGDLWIGTETSGALELRDRAFEMIGRSQGLGEGSATSVVASGKGALWVGTSTGGVSYIDNTSRTHAITVADGLASNTVLSLATAGADPTDVWIGTPDGLSHLQNGHVKNYSTADGLADDFVRSLLVAHDGAVWIGTRHGVTRWQNEHATTWTTAQGLGSNLIGAIAEDAEGDVWIGTLHGLSHVHHGAVRNYAVADGLPSDTVTALSIGTDGALWVGSNGHGLSVREGQRFFSYSAVSALPRTVFGILEDRLGFLWLSSEHGLDRVALSELAAYRADRHHAIAITHYGAADGLGSSEGSDVGHPSAARTEDGHLCFATRRGIVVVAPALLPSGHAVPPVSIEQMTADDREVTRAEMASLPPGPSHFSFTFAGINLAAPQRLQYRYKLEGFDRDWIDAGTRRTAFYTNVPPGHYRFLVNARSGSDPWREDGSAVSIWLQPRFYQTMWFRLLLLCVFVALLIGLYLLRLRTLKKQFDAVAAERNRLAREIHDTLAQGFVAVSVRLEILSQVMQSSRLEECRQHLDETRALVQESLGEARRSIWNLRAEGAKIETLPARLGRTVQDIITKGVDAELDTTGAYRSLGTRVEDELYRITQEAVTNALRHAEPTEVRIELVYTPDLLRLEISDDGRGFDVAAAPSKDQGHFGLAGLRERAQQIGATLMLESMPGRGTTVRVETSIARERI